MSLEGSGTGRGLATPGSLASTDRGTDWPKRGDFSAGGGRERGSGDSREGIGGFGDFSGRVLSTLADGGLSGLLGGVLKGETLSSKELRSCVAASAPPSNWEMFAGFAGIFGFSALLTGGGTEVLFAFPTGETSLAGRGASTEPPDGEFGVFGRENERDGLCHEADLGETSEAPRFSEDQCSPPCRTSTPRGGERGESTVRTGVRCGEDPICMDIGREYLRPPDDPFRVAPTGAPLEDPDDVPVCWFSVAVQGDRGRGRSSEARAAGCEASG